jgi:hypothetical protein
VITKAALLEQLLMSSSCEMIFLTRATNDGLDLDTGVDDGVFWGLQLWLSQGREALVDIRGRDTVPVTSLEGAIGVLLYGMLAESGGEE